MPSVLITGANRGIGLEFARAYAADGWLVHACCRHPDKATDLKAIKHGIQIHRLDVTDGLQVASLARELADASIDLLINNAGIYGPRVGFGEIDYDDWLEVLKINTLAPQRVVERFVEHVAKSERKVIVNISSRMGSIGSNSSGGSYIYRSSKTALNMVTKCQSIDLAARGITVICFHPGWVQTDMGGGGADIPAVDSVKGMRKVIAGLSRQDSGSFFNFDGTPIAW